MGVLQEFIQEHEVLVTFQTKMVPQKHNTQYKQNEYIMSG